MKIVKKIFATDMDGTFLRSDRSYDAVRLAQLLQRFDEVGALFCASSGRQLLALYELFAPVKDKIAYVAENGGLVAIGDEIISQTAFDKLQMEELMRQLQLMPETPQEAFMISGLKGAYLPLTTTEAFFEKAKIYYANVQKVGSLSEIDDAMLKITTNFPEAHLFESADWINAHIPFARATPSGFTSIDIIPAGISKASGLAQLAAHLRLTAAEVTAFGDQMNDLEMLEYAGTATAVGNAVEGIKAVADTVIGNNDADSVLAEMERLLEK